MPGVIKQNVLIRFDDADPVILEMLFQPISLHQRFRMRVFSWMRSHRKKICGYSRERARDFTSLAVITEALGSARLQRAGESVLANANFSFRCSTFAS